ncbi:hypothetical protein PGQ11_003810 [Apiospora arundinis]|uniref:Uncharacterized protein n=1 Tax=Apiospora arundinis TaxID=335852 RepID=A0ABR2J6Y7_9PEZI
MRLHTAVLPTFMLLVSAVSLTQYSLSLSRCSHPVQAMAPADLQMVLVDYRGQIFENCEFITAKDEFISIITPKEPSGKFKAIALRTTKKGETREPLIASDSFDTVQEAIASLHTKSSEAVHLYTVANGYAEPRDLDEVKDDNKLGDDNGDSDSDSDDDASVVSSDSASSTNAPSVWSATSDTAAEIPTPASLTNTASAPFRSTRRAPKSAKKKGKADNDRKTRKPPTTVGATAAAARKPRDDYLTEEDEDEDEDAGPPRVRVIHHPVRQTVPPPSVVAGRHNAPRQQLPPPPPPSWAGPPPPPPPPFRSLGGGKPMNGFGLIPQPGPPPPPNIGARPQYVQTQGMPPPAPPQQQQSSIAHGSSSHPGPLAPLHMGGNGGPQNSMVGPPGVSSSSTTPPHLQQQQGLLPNAQYHNNSTSTTRIISLTPPKLHDVRLTITWLHHSSARILETVRPSLRALQDAALAYVRNNPHAFENVTAADLVAPPPPNPYPPGHHPSSSQAPSSMPARPGSGGGGGGGIWALRASVKRAWFGDESWDLASYRGGDDLTRLFASLGQGTIPRLEVEVDYPRP